MVSRLRITGSIGRWAPVHGVSVPYEAIEVDGARAWRWTGLEDDAAPEPEVDAAPEGDPEDEAAIAPEPEPEPEPAGDYGEFVARLPDRSRRFLDLIRTRGTLTIADAMDELNVTVPRAIGGITGSIGGWAPVHGVTVPYEAVQVDGARAWRWKGPEGDYVASDGDEAEADVEWATFAATLPEKSQRLLDLLKRHGTVTVELAVEALGLSGPRAMGGLTGAMKRSAAKLGLDLPFEARKGEDGRRVWVWMA